MTLRRAALYIGGASLLVAWFSSAASLTVSRNNARLATEAEQSMSPIEELGARVEQQTKRLRAHLTSAPKPQPQTRNPFAFRETLPRSPVPLSRRVQANPAPTAPAEPPEPVLRLIGLAEHKREQGLVRTAVLIGQAEDLIMVTAGDMVLERYKVVGVSVDAVDLTDVTTGRTRRLVLEAP